MRPTLVSLTMLWWGTGRPNANTRWNYQAGDPGRINQHYVIICLIEGIPKAVIKPVNYTKLKEITQSPNENPDLFHSHLVEAMRKCINPDPQGPAGMAILVVPFIRQASPDIRQKLPKLDQEAQTSLPTLWIRPSRSSIAQREPQGLIGNRETSSKPNIWLQLSLAPCPSLGPPRGRSHYRYRC